MDVSISHFPSHCGSRILHNFGNTSISKTGLKQSLSKKYYRTFFSIYINREDQRIEYENLKKMYKILYQSPILVNPSTNIEYIIVIHLNEKP